MTHHRHRRETVADIQTTRGQMRVETGPQPLPDADLPSFDPLAGVNRTELLAGLRDGTITVKEKEEEKVAAQGVDDLMAGWVGKKDRTQYDASKVYVRATNRNDHSTTVQFAIPKEVMTWVDRIVGERSEYKSRADFCRDAIYHGIWRLVKMVERGEIDDGDGVLGGDGLRRMLLLEMFRCEQAEQQAEVDGLTKVVEDAELLFAAIVEAGDPAHMDRAVEFHTVLAEQMPDVWRDKINAVVGKWERAWKARWIVG